MKTEIALPFYARLAFVLIALCILIAFVHYGQNIFIPLLLSLLLAIMLRPVVVFLNKRIRLPHVIAVFLTVLLFMLVVAGIILFIYYQVGDMASDWDQIKKNINSHLQTIQSWIRQKFNMPYAEQEKYIEEAKKESINGSGDFVTTTIEAFTGALFYFILMPVYIFLFLLYRNLFLKFLTKLFSEEHHTRLKDIVLNIKITVQSFLTGLAIEMCIVATLTSTGLMIVGVPYAVLLGVLTGVLNLIPYIGITMAAILSVMATLTTSTDFSLVFGVILVNVIVQLLDNNLLVPLIVSSKVKINALVSIAGIVLGGAVAGVAGMFLAIPMIAIAKVIFDRVENMEPWGYVLGDDLPKTYEWKKIKWSSLDVGTSSDTGNLTKKPDPNVIIEPKKLDDNGSTSSIA